MGNARWRGPKSSPAIVFSADEGQWIDWLMGDVPLDPELDLPNARQRPGPVKERRAKSCRRLPAGSQPGYAESRAARD
jgi:hypothetical protein